MLESTLNEGVSYDAANFENNGRIFINQVGDDGINTGKDCTNNGTIVITETEVDGIDVEDGTVFFQYRFDARVVPYRTTARPTKRFPCRVTTTI